STYWRTGSSGDASGSCRIVTITSLSRSSITGSLNPNSRILSKAVFRRCLATVRSGNWVIEVTSEAESLEMLDSQLPETVTPLVRDEAALLATLTVRVMAG